MNIEEQWKDVVGFENGYEVSNLGNVRSKTRTLPDGRTFRGRPLKPWISEGYARLTLPNKTKVKVHRLVCRAFHGEPPEDKPFALHRNGDSLDNRADNLYWGDFVDNVADALRHGTHAQIHSLKTHCPQNHPYDGENTYVRPGTTHRYCRKCVGEAGKRYRLKKSQGEDKI